MVVYNIVVDRQGNEMCIELYCPGTIYTYKEGTVEYAHLQRWMDQCRSWHWNDQERNDYITHNMYKYGYWRD